MSNFLKINFKYNYNDIGAAFYSDIVDDIQPLRILKNILSKMYNEVDTYSEMSRGVEKYYLNMGSFRYLEDLTNTISGEKIFLPDNIFTPKGIYLRYQVNPGRYCTNIKYDLIDIDLKTNEILFTGSRLFSGVVSGFMRGPINISSQDDMLKFLNLTRPNKSFAYYFNTDEIDDIICKIRVRDIARELKQGDENEK